MKPPNAMTIGNVTGSSQMAGAPSCAPQRPTAIIASTWSSPGERVQKPGQKPARLSLLIVRQHAAAAASEQHQQNERHPRARHRRLPSSISVR